MKYTPYTEAQIQSMNVMEEGTYRFQVLEVHTTGKTGEPLCDKNGIDMAKLKLVIWDNMDRERTIFTFISGDGNFAYKLRHFAKSIGQIEQYEQGTFNINTTIGKSGLADIVVKKGTIKADGSGEMWPDRNDVKDFVVAANQQNKPVGAVSLTQPSNIPPSNDLVDDDCPF